jgi:hypothetical protein
MQGNINLTLYYVKVTMQALLISNGFAMQALKALALTHYSKNDTNLPVSALLT